MNINNVTNDATTTIQIEGSINTQTAPEFEKDVRSILESTKNIIIDLAKVDYISSAGLRVILMTQNEIEGKGSLKIINISADVKEVFDLTGFSSILDLG